MIKKVETFKALLDTKDLYNLEQIFYEDEYFILVKKKRMKNFNYKITFTKVPATSRNWEIFKSVFFSKKLK